MPSLALATRNSQSVRHRVRQLHLIAELPTEAAAEPKSLKAKLAPAAHHRTDQDRYWLVCGYDGRPFGGLYYREEVDHILQHFERWRGPIRPSAFGIVAERAMMSRNQRMGVAA